MRFDAIVHAPTLRVGARLNIAAADQAADGSPQTLVDGAEIRLRFGVCCPDHACGTITGHRAEDPDRAILSVDTRSWAIRKGIGGVTDPGLQSETWFVMAATDPV